MSNISKLPAAQEVSSRTELFKIDEPADPGKLYKVLANCLKQLEQTKVLIWQNNAVYSGVVTGGQIVLQANAQYCPGQLLEIRAFNETEELYIYKSRQGWNGRYIDDTVGDKTTYVDSAARIWGENNFDCREQGFRNFADSGRRISLVLPTELNCRYAELVTRSYIGYHDLTHQAYYKDYRFVQIVEGRQN